MDRKGRVQIFAETQVEGSQDGPALECQFLLWIKYKQRSSRWMGREEFKHLLEPRLKEAKMALLWNVRSSNQLVFVLSLTLLYTCDTHSNPLKIITPLSETARFLKSVVKLYDAFSVHKKGQSPPLKTLSEALEKVKECNQILTEYENSVHSIVGCSKVRLTTRHGFSGNRKVG